MKVHLESAIERWFSDDISPEDAAANEGFIQWAFSAGHFDDDDLEGDPPENSIIDRFVEDPESPSDLKALADDWSVYGRWGLWQVHGRVMGQPGYLVTDIVTGQAIYASFDESLGDIHPWSVLMGLMVPINGIWRSTAALVSLSPSEGEATAREIYRRADMVVRDQFGEGFDLEELEGVPLGVVHEPPGSDVLTHLFGSVTNLSFPDLIGLVEEGRSSPPTLVNTDGDEMMFLRVEAQLNDPEALISALRSHKDFREDSGDFTWPGKQMSRMELESSLAEAR